MVHDLSLRIAAVVVVIHLSCCVTTVSSAFLQPYPSAKQKSAVMTPTKTTQKTTTSLLSLIYSSRKRKWSATSVFANNDNDDGTASSSPSSSTPTETTTPVTMRLEQISSVQEEFSEQAMQDFEEGQPSEWMVMKDLLGINIFTYLLAGLILFFFSMNLLLGPGWLGNAIGIQGAGTMNQISDSLPETIDLSRPDYLI